ncbi:MAG: hypothetical protein IT275_08675 [Chitinophagales bacterium]|nr:hypothetical protein [Chitinophagales bacterium]HMV15850.1 hypothetical protein [Chitinophagales bacterium]HMW13527.1 hypothetical protein [Chitinophagales bacterium]HMX60792.1 hypothetical protein [Chitinophagales bacterium]HMY23144.1 hypothetical protein [Chitinophagales bacterium]
MKNIYKILSLFTLLLIVLAPFQLLANSHDTDKNSEPIVKSIWKYEQDQTKYSPEDGIAKKIFYLSLNSDGTYHQYVQVIPSSPRDYFKVKNYSIDGKWTEKNGKLILIEYGKENAIDYNFLYTNFENIDNQVVKVK